MVGVDAVDITLQVRSGSVSIVATITPQSTAVASAAQASLTALINSGTAAMSNVLHVPVTTVSPPTLVLPPPPPSGAAPGLTVAVIVGIAVGSAVIALGICAPVLYFCFARRPHAQALMSNYLGNYDEPLADSALSGPKGKGGGYFQQSDMFDKGAQLTKRETYLSDAI